MGIIALFSVILFYIFYVQQIKNQREISVSESRNFDRLTHVNILASAIDIYRKKEGKLPGEITSNPRIICRSDVDTFCADMVNLSPLLNKYLVTFPIDPLGSTVLGTGYVVSKNKRGEIIVSAPNAENDSNIQAIR